MNGEANKTSIDSRPVFPKRAVITGGMPYGNKDLHFGHIGGIFVHADIFARFLRDRIGKDNVIFVSGTDCYGSPIVEYFRKAKDSGEFDGDITEFVRFNHERQKEVLDSYHISLNLFGTSSFGPSSEIHGEMCSGFLRELYENGHLVKLTTPQFYDPEREVFLNGRQVTGRCPIPGCSSEKGYADECDLGHQYMPQDLIAPKSTLTGEKPEMRDVSNWYLKLPAFQKLLEKWVAKAENIPGSRLFMVKSIKEFLDKPTIHIKQDLLEQVTELKDKLPAHTREEGMSKSFKLVFETLEQREEACRILAENSIFYRNGKTLTPFRLTGNIEWGLPAPDMEDLKGLTFWVWPESLWAPISFTATYLEQQGKNRNGWKDWWCSGDSQVYQILGEDNVYFYGPAEMAMFMGSQGKDPVANPPEGRLQLPELIVNNHLLFLRKKASSSGEVKPPMAREFLEFYTSDQLRAHFISLGLAIRSIDFKPKPFNPAADERDADPVLKEGNLLCNVFNRAVRSCFYTAQKYADGKIPVGTVSKEIIDEAKKVILEFESTMYRHEFHLAMTVADNYIRGINKFWDKNIKAAGKEYNEAMKQTLVDTFHMVRVAAVLMHPIAPTGTEMIREYLNLGEEFWDWDRIFDPLYSFMENPEQHELKFLEPRVDFFEKHPSQVSYK
ncbi:MAG: class I tRNA ligase family protein [Spirochaetales bacterium]|nr:class I tRNA ligase family protein [Spirochaetales bacterium]